MQRDKTTRVARLTAAVGVALGVALGAGQAEAFCGFYVGGADAKLFNNATQVVLLREGTRTVLSMQNNYQGPPSNFAMVVPVPVVLQKENVKTLPREVFDRIDQLSAPRLVEYWEQDPCPVERGDVSFDRMSGVRYESMPAPMAAAAPGGLGVKIEAQFAVGEYEIVILSAEDALGLDTWLRREKYHIPENAEPALRPYVQSGSKFFVAKVDVEKVKLKNGQATLSPLRFFYDDDRFMLPVRLGLINSSGTQDLIVNILARQQRYEVANYPNATIPTNLEISEQGKAQFGAFYAALFDRTVEQTPKAVVTEYAWAAGSCDPCPGPSLSPTDLTLLGGDVATAKNPVVPSNDPLQPFPTRAGLGVWEVTLTRLHARYGKESLGEDLVFRKAPPIRGGNENWGGKNSQGAEPLSQGNQSTFQGRYILRHPWEGPVTCASPRFGVWGGPPGGNRPPEVARDLASAPRGQANFKGWLAENVAALSLEGTPRPEPKRVYDVPLTAHLRGPRWPALGGLLLGLLAVGALFARHRRAQ